MSTDLAIVEPGGYLALQHQLDEIKEIIADNLGGDELTEFDLPRVKVPSGGSTIWEIPSLTGTEGEKVLSGVVVHFKLTRAYWDPDADTGTPPQCRSNDGRIGVGDPGGDCKTCPLAQYGTAVDDKGQPAPGQACNAKEIWFMLRPGSFLPLVVALPATSLKAAKAHRTVLAGAGIKLPAVVTEITLKATKNAKGDSYAIIEPKVGGMLSPEEAQRAAEYAAALRPIFDAAAEQMAGERNGATDSTAEEA